MSISILIVDDRPDNLLALEAVLAMPERERSLPVFLRKIAEIHPEADRAFAAWAEGGDLAPFFHHAADALRRDTEIIGFSLANVADHPAAFIPLMAYLLQKTETLLDGRPTILVLDNAHYLLNNTHVAMDIEGWLERLTARNALAVFLTEVDDATAAGPVLPALMPHIATQCYLGDAAPHEAYMRVCDLSEKESTFLEVMDSSTYHFLLKRHGETILTEADWSDREDILAVLSGKNNEETLAKTG